MLFNVGTKDGTKYRKAPVIMVPPDTIMFKVYTNAQRKSSRTAGTAIGAPGGLLKNRSRGLHRSAEPRSNVRDVWSQIAWISIGYFWGTQVRRQSTEVRRQTIETRADGPGSDDGRQKPESRCPMAGRVRSAAPWISASPRSALPPGRLWRRRQRRRRSGLRTSAAGPLRRRCPARSWRTCRR